MFGGTISFDWKIQKVTSNILVISTHTDYRLIGDEREFVYSKILLIESSKIF